jgi:hypothetical protein
MMNENEQENEKRETLADIFSEYRKDMDEMVAHRQCAPSIRYVARLLDRIEAAWKRECEASRAYWTKKCRDTITEHDRYCSPVGNAAAMREALESFMVGSCVYPCVSCGYDPIDEVCMRCAASPEKDGDCPYEKARKALSVPARNCDMLSAEQCKEIFKMEMGIYLTQEATDRDRDISLCTAYGVIDTLFATYTERKGEGDGR